MNILLDTHILLWALTNDERLPIKARELILNNENNIFYSIASIWEIEIKHLFHPDKMPVSGDIVEEYCIVSGFSALTISTSHIYQLKTLKRPTDAPPHKDPFDRIMICQAKADNLLFVSHDRLIADYNESCVLNV